ncbi:MAG: tRNA (adenosine(37)-N6)-threonylcarbamoyltransferase complex ATPase subunit type 1 TsaE [Rhizobiaceae bacterium]|nr:tRNA (adenosine(37)-N6)-threonylcarbamoyltransferase complex ATPase subunit type 1 TsaE [Rhizobiaceae bacterium]
MVDFRIELPDPAATDRLGDDIAAALRPGDLVALSGDLGAGKSALARAMIRAIAGDHALEVPSPTFTLVQNYALRFPVLHVDLYRIGSPDELDELGIDEALKTGVALVEWPDKGGTRLPAPAIAVALSESGAGRVAEIVATGAAAARLTRSLAIRDFLAENGRAEARRNFLVGDASTRAYETVRSVGEPPRVLMNAPKQPDGPPIRDGKPYSRIAKLAESVVPFVAVAKALKEAGLAAPEILAQDLDAGLLLTEHLGSEGILDTAGAPGRERYEAAGALLATVHAHRWNADMPAAPGVVHRVPDYDREAMAIETELLVDWYVPYALERKATEAERAAYGAAWAQLFDRLEGAERSLVLRDYHSPNLIWRADRAATDRLGIIDFQDAVMGPAAYDVASLAMDARVNVSPEVEAATVAAYIAARGEGFDRAGFAQAYAIMAAQRNSKILGIFVRLNVRDGKPQYLKHLPRIRGYLRRALAHPALAELKALYESLGVLSEPAA